MNKTTLITLVGIIFFSFTSRADFLGEQKKYSRVRTAITEKQALIEKKLAENHITLDNLNLLFVAYKDNDVLDVYAKTKQEKRYKKVFSYTICSRSGKLGPKRKEGDRQVPEGFYHINRFNPSSNYYLSLGLNYPNLSDRRKSKASKLGGDIFIHGSCVTIGCLPMKDSYIKEIYLLAVHAKNNGQSNIPVYIFPFKMTNQNMNAYKKRYKNNKELTLFWDNLKPGYDQFITTQQEVRYHINKNGDYTY